MQHMTVAPNGMNLRRSMQHPGSRARKILAYLQMYGPRSKAAILWDVFGKQVITPVWPKVESKYCSTGWATYVFQLLQGHGYIQKVRVGRGVVYQVAPR